MSRAQRGLRPLFDWSGARQTADALKRQAHRPTAEEITMARQASRLRGSKTGSFPGDTGVSGKGKSGPTTDARPRKYPKRDQVGGQKPADASAGLTKNAKRATTGVKGATQKPKLRQSAGRSGLPNAVDSRNAKLAGAKRRTNTKQGVARG